MEQSISIDGLVSHVTELSSQIKDSSTRCNDASELVDKANGFASEADTKMAELIESTKNIGQSSAKIVGIIKTIEDIAFQTNILALNASKQPVPETPEKASPLSPKKSATLPQNPAKPHKILEY